MSVLMREQMGGRRFIHRTAASALFNVKVLIKLNGCGGFNSAEVVSHQHGTVIDSGGGYFF